MTVTIDNVYVSQILSAVGEQLEEIDLSGSIMSSLTDAGLKSISTHCFQLQILGEYNLHHS